MAPGRAYPRVGFIVTNLTRPAERASRFYNGRGTVEQWIKEGKLALRWTRLSCRAFRDNAIIAMNDNQRYHYSAIRGCKNI